MPVLPSGTRLAGLLAAFVLLMRVGAAAELDHALRLDVNPADGDTYVVQATAMKGGEEHARRILVEWTAPEGARRTLMLGWVHDGTWASLVEAPEPGTHQLNLVDIELGSEGQARRVETTIYDLDLPECALKRRSFHVANPSLPILPALSFASSRRVARSEVTGDQWEAALMVLLLINAIAVAVVGTLVVGLLRAPASVRRVLGWPFALAGGLFRRPPAGTELLIENGLLPGREGMPTTGPADPASRTTTKI